ncbi:hypothetical protein E2C01_010082 [Portunus trituberculatus]|uniref:Uncharacterized protein n=1 Tax=Portunus trituberculatus TaxID=210409 RepID=A0A5B7D7J9_PORTR|nr:hypothetical protein [Portunus trituberculatus]
MTANRLHEGVSSYLASPLIFLCPCVLNPFSTRTCFYIHSVYYLVTLYSFRNFCGD